MVHLSVKLTAEIVPGIMITLKMYNENFFTYNITKR